MKFTKKDIEEFKFNRFFAWMGDRFISPACISFTDYMYKSHWIITREKTDTKITYVLKRKKNRGRKFHEVSLDIPSITDALLMVELTLWNEALETTPDLSHIPLLYILDTPQRLALDTITIPFLMTIVPMKLKQGGML
ncbi:MAG: hypothetical protein K6G87_00835 [Butyrivibrio sp.]|uniref:hypothetical protein n=1 Tax=Butyrivibrio sp. TaxID=28121 RepID=UPI0025FFFADA|nr:hypothetical protein [Butyrivibrio sp.]MCR5769757.1 hypothetical protein [Butyrivibrio sp.]